jgi:hypothetical protein
MNDEQKREHRDQKLTSEQLAALIIDALIDAGLVHKPDFEKAVSVAAEEIDARKAVDDY